jgi:epoxide hydrolase
MSDEITPFRIDVPEADLEDLRERLRRTRWPEAETVDDWSQGTPLAYARRLCEHWRERYDFLGPVHVPAGCSIFPREIFRPSRRWAERQFLNLHYWNELDKGGHFAAFEQPETFVNEVRASFRPLR